jgi:putative tryptophan/tyrosine transport system substrate-binding protein
MIRRRDFITLLGGAVATWPMAARAQQQAMPVIGVLGSASTQFKDALAAGLKESGYIDGQNVRIEYRWAEGDYDRLPAMADELVKLHVNVLAILGTAAARVAKSASLKVSPPVPVVFALGADPVAMGLVASFNRPGGNITGSTSIAHSLAPKRLELLRAFVRGDAAMAIMVNPDTGEIERKESEAAALAMGRRLEVLTARNESEIIAAFATVRQRRIGGLIVASDTFYLGQMRWMAALAAWHAVPAIGPLREFAGGGGLMTYAPSIADVVRQAGAYVGKVLKGARPAELPVMQPTKFELTINLKAAKALGLDVPTTLLATADELIE